MRALVVTLVLLAGCHSQEAPAKPVNVHTQLTATLTLARHDYAKDADVEVTVDLANSTPNPVEIPAQALESAVLLLDVSDGKGRHVQTVPPPTPRADTVKLAPGEHRTVKVSLGVFSPPLPAGDYIVSPATAIAAGNPASFAIR